MPSSSRRNSPTMPEENSSNLCATLPVFAAWFLRRSREVRGNVWAEVIDKGDAVVRLFRRPFRFQEEHDHPEHAAAKIDAAEKPGKSRRVRVGRPFCRRRPACG